MYIKRGEDLLTQVEKTKKNKFSNFHNPQEVAAIIKKLSNKSPLVTLKAFGGFEGAERKIIAFQSTFVEEVATKKFPMVVMEISYDRRFSKQMGHRDFLGALIGLGIDRAFMGDILVFEEKAMVYMTGPMGKYAHDNLTQVGSAPITTQILGLEAVEAPDISYQVKRITVASLRVDAVIAQGFNVSRQKASACIKEKKVFINWELVNRNGAEVALKDVITVRGLGRIQMDSLLGASKKNRLIMNVHIYGR